MPAASILRKTLTKAVIQQRYKGVRLGLVENEVPVQPFQGELPNLLTLLRFYTGAGTKQQQL
jgi:hypothetical protein